MQTVPKSLTKTIGNLAADLLLLCIKDVSRLKKQNFGSPVLNIKFSQAFIKWTLLALAFCFEIQDTASFLFDAYNEPQPQKMRLGLSAFHFISISNKWYFELLEGRKTRRWMVGQISAKFFTGLLLATWLKNFIAYKIVCNSNICMHEKNPAWKEKGYWFILSL